MDWSSIDIHIRLIGTSCTVHMRGALCWGRWRRAIVNDLQNLIYFFSFVLLLSVSFCRRSLSYFYNSECDLPLINTRRLFWTSGFTVHCTIPTKFTPQFPASFVGRTANWYSTVDYIYQLWGQQKRNFTPKSWISGNHLFCSGIPEPNSRRTSCNPWVYLRWAPHSQTVKVGK